MPEKEYLNKVRKAKKEWEEGPLKKSLERFGVKESPIKREPTRPGPQVTAMPSISFRLTLASSRAVFKMGKMVFICSLEASSGTTPQYLL